MKEKRFIPVLALVAISTVLMIHSCSKEDDRNITPDDIALAQDEVYIDALYSEVDNLVESAVNTLDLNDYQPNALKSTEEMECAVITVDHPDSETFPKVITIDYGEGCTIVFRDDTITYSGQIVITVTDRFNVTGAQRIVTLNDFYINDTKIEGTRTISNLGPNDEGNKEVQVTLENGKLIFEDGSSATRTTNIIRERIREEEWIDDKIIITGSSYGINVLGEEYIREITDPIVLIRCYDYHYRFIRVDGTITITNSVKGVITIDFGDGTCEGALVMNKHGKRHNLRFLFRARRF